MQEFKTLEYDKIINLLAQETRSALGREKVEKLQPAQTFEEAQQFLEETHQAKVLLDVGKLPPLTGFHDVRQSVQKASRGILLDVDELLVIQSFLSSVNHVKQFFQNLDESYETIVPILFEWAKQLESLPKLETRLENIFDIHGKIKDDATTELFQIRRELKSIQKKLQDTLQKILHDLTLQKYFQEAIVTTRDDRYVLPIKREYRNAFPGIVHDQSSTGATLFIEPMAMVNLNNDKKQLELDEQQEVARILQKLTIKIGENSTIFLRNTKILARFDFTFAKAKFALTLQATRPELNQDGKTVLYKARHPLISAAEIVPIDLSLGEKFRILLITGPNTGGKTVTLKTLGLFALMAKSGLFLPALDGSKISFYPKIFADIGDEQSISQSLSTFSAHIKHIIKILQHVEKNDLVLLDEIGAGTDPSEGAALSMAILNFLREKESHVLATTHYPELKTFAYHYDTIENACVEFDAKTLKPTYKLLIGIPGASNAFYISQRLGLSKKIIADAESFINTEQANFEKTLRDLQAQKKSYEEKQDELAQREHEIFQREEKIKSSEEKFLQKREKLLRDAQNESSTLIRRAKIEIKEIIKALNAEFNQNSPSSREQTIGRARQVLSDLSHESQKLLKQEQLYNQDEYLPIDPKTLQVGDKIFLKSLQQVGTVLSIRGKNLQVQANDLTINTSIQSCLFCKNQTKNKSKILNNPTSSKKISVAKIQSVHSEIDLRGKLVDEALELVSKFLDDALLAGLKQIRIIHGKGTGALQKAIWEFLKTQKDVSSFSFAGEFDGGMGATVVKL